MPFTEINKIIDAGASSERDLKLLAKELGIKLNFVGSIFDIKSLKPGNYILLISPSKKIRNGHWVALRVLKKSCKYFDSYAMPPPRVLEDNCKNLSWNKIQVQDLRSSHCGLFCIYWLKHGAKIFDKLTQYND